MLTMQLIYSILLYATLSPAPVTATPTVNSISTPITIPLLRHHGHLQRRTNPIALQEWALREKGRIRGKYGEEEILVEKRQITPISTAGVVASTTRIATTTSSATRTTSASANSSIPTHPVGQVQILNYEADLEYYASVGIGAPAQYMNVILDTGSADLWIASSTCTPTTGCSGIPLYNTSLSLTGEDTATTFTVRYGAGAASGEVWKDYVGFGGYNVSGQGFAICDTVSSGLLNGNLSGLFGLGFQPLAASGQTPFWQNLYQAGVFPFPGFAFALTRLVNISTAALVEPGGQLTIGYLNSSFYQPPINYIPMPQGDESYWLIPMDAVAVNGTNVTGLGSPHVAIDTGTTLIGGPEASVAAVYSLIPGSQAATGAYSGYYSYPCASAVNISLQFGGISYNISSDDFNLGPFGRTNNVSTCLGAFFNLNFSTTSKITWVIGAAFLKNVYSVYRASPPSVGFALLSNLNISSPSLSNGTIPANGSTFGNGTNLPNGFFGPSGVTSLKMSSTTMTTSAASPTTAIAAGQVSSPAPTTRSHGTRRSEGSILVSLLLAIGVGII